MGESRKITNKLLEMVEEGILNSKEVLLAALNYISEDDVAEMAIINEFINDENF